VLAGIGSKSLWSDEAFSLVNARMGLGDLWDLVARREANQGLYLFFLSGWTALAEGEGWLRLPSALLAIATVPLLYLVGRRLFGPVAATLAATLLAVNAMVVEQAQTARGYTVTIFAVVLASWCFLRFVEDQSRGRFAAWVAASLLLPYCHFFGLLVLGGHAASLLFLRDRPLPWRRFVLGGALIGLGSLPIVFVALLKDEGQLDWVPKTTPTRLLGTIASLGSGQRAPVALAVVLALGIAACCLVALAPAVRSRRLTWPLAFPVCWFAVPIVTASLVSLARPVLVPRYFSVTVPALALLVGAGLAALAPRRRAIGAAALVVLSLAAVVNWHRIDSVEDWDGATGYVLDNARPGDAVLFIPWHGRIPFELYAEDQIDAGGFPLRIVYPAADVAPGEYQTGNPAPLVDRETGARVARSEDRLWYVYREPRGSEHRDFVQQLEDSGHRAEQTWRDGRDMQVTLYVR
jgi:mannosyltransferase